MGICFSSTKERKPVKADTISNVRRLPARAPPPEHELEESVKEVLSETPKPRPKFRPREDAPLKPPMEKQQQLKDHNDVGKILVPVNSSGFFDDRSEDTEAVSEAYSASLSQSETTTTTTTTALSVSASTTVTEKRRPKAAPEEIEKKKRGPKEIRLATPVAKHQRKRSVSGEFSCRRDQSVAVGCRSVRSSPSPARRGGADAAVARTSSAREAGGQAARSQISSCTKKDPGERSGRRSVSPAGKRAAELRQNGLLQAGGGQCRGLSTVRMNGRASPRRIPEGEAKKCGHGGAAGGEDVGGAAGVGKESLENPLVSMECFIFL